MRADQESSKTFVIAGCLLLGAGFFLLLDQVLKTGWITLAVFPLAGLGLLIMGGIWRSGGWMISGSLLLGVGGAFLCYMGNFWSPVNSRIGMALMVFGGAWVLISAHSLLTRRVVSWWALVPAAVIFSIGYSFWTQTAGWLDFTFYIPLFLGGAFLMWGVARRLFGLIIPGCLLATIGPGIFYGWGSGVAGNGLVQTGIMLAWFAFGWGLITVFSRRVYPQVIWWPLIPAGVLAVTGWGLYIGGDPSNAVNFIGNTGTIGVLVFGLYLILIRRGIRQ